MRRGLGGKLRSWVSGWGPISHERSELANFAIQHKQNVGDWEDELAGEQPRRAGWLWLLDSELRGVWLVSQVGKIFYRHMDGTISVLCLAKLNS